MIYIGHVAKTHGLNGHFSIKLNMPYDLCELSNQIKQIYIPPVDKPMSISNSTLNNKVFLRVKSTNINTREDAKNILRNKVYIKKGNQPNMDAKWNQKYEFLNFNIIDKKEGEIGYVQEIDFNRPQTLLIIKNNENSLLVPFVEEFIVNINQKNKTIYVDLPENLVKICNQ